jgi:co-chaperonin GroES (HSP10)
MKTIKPIHDKVLAKMIDGFGEKKTAGGLIIQEKDGTADAIRPRWFEVVYVGPEQKDVNPGEYVLVAHGRWSRGVTIDPADDYKLYFLDNDEMLAVSDELPNEVQ